jgi:hypothetical protein
MQCPYCTFQRKFTPVSAKLKVSSKISLHPYQATRRHIPEDMGLNMDHFTNMTLYNICTTYIQYTSRDILFPFDVKILYRSYFILQGVV